MKKESIVGENQDALDSVASKNIVIKKQDE